MSETLKLKYVRIPAQSPVTGMTVANIARLMVRSAGVKDMWFDLGGASDQEMARPAEYAWKEGGLLERLKELAEAYGMSVEADEKTIWFTRLPGPVQPLFR